MIAVSAPSAPGAQMPTPASVDDVAADRMVIRLVGLAFLASIATSHRFWIGPRSYPALPIVPGWTLPPTVQYGVGAILIAILVAAVLRPSRRFIVAVLVSFAALCFFDITALQPWAYQYALILGALTFGTNEHRLTLVRWIFGLTYAWSALHKLNPGFFETVVPLFHPFGEPDFPLLAGLVMITVELAVGVGLLMRRTAQPAAILAVLMHASILLMRSVDGANVAVWPWNVAVPTLAVLCAWSADRVDRREWREALKGYGRVVLVLCGGMPLLGALGFWDPYPSFMMYTGNIDRATIVLAPEDVKRLELSPYVVGEGNAPTLEASEWPLREMEVPGYPAAWAHRRLFAALCERTGRPEAMEMILRQRLTLLQTQPAETIYRCR